MRCTQVKHHLRVCRPTFRRLILSVCGILRPSLKIILVDMRELHVFWDLVTLLHTLGFSLIVLGSTLNTCNIPSREGPIATKFHHQDSPISSMHEQTDRLMEH